MYAIRRYYAAGEPDIKEKLKEGYTANGKMFKVHLDGYDQRDLRGPTLRNRARTLHGLCLV